MAATPSEDYLRVCDICGHRYHFSDLKPIGEIEVRPAPTTPRGSRRYRVRVGTPARARLKVKPNRFAKELVQTPTYALPRGPVLQRHRNPANPALLSVGPSGPCWWSIYLGLTLQQGLRPPIWLAKASAQLRAHLDALLVGQYGSPTGTAAAAISDPKYGGISNGTTILVLRHCPGWNLRSSWPTAPSGDAKYLQAA